MAQTAERVLPLLEEMAEEAAKGDGAKGGATGAKGAAAGRAAAAARDRSESPMDSGCFCGTKRHLPASPYPFDGVWVQCEACQGWCHGECAGMTREQVSTVVSGCHLPNLAGGHGGERVSPS